MGKLWFIHIMENYMTMRMRKQTPTTYKNTDESHRYNIGQSKSHTKQNTFYDTVIIKYKNRPNQFMA
jgi:1,2-phenylacetyl-CoA epoxidase PaaB subunit